MHEPHRPVARAVEDARAALTKALTAAEKAVEQAQARVTELEGDDDFDPELVREEADLVTWLAATLEDLEAADAALDRAGTRLRDGPP